jgi:hypothetical protein
MAILKLTPAHSLHLPALSYSYGPHNQLITIHSLSMSTH